MEKVVYEKKDRIAYVTLNRPDALNALDDELEVESPGGSTGSRSRSSRPSTGMRSGAVSSWLWPATFVSLRKRPNSVSLKFATDFTKGTEVLSGLSRSLGLLPL